jgi:serine/threonine protein kinase
MLQPLRPEVEHALAEVLELPETEQQRYLAGHDSTLRAEVESLVRAHRAAGDFLERVAPTKIGKFQIIRLLGEGGMGVVYEAQQEQPRRAVALKLLKPGYATPEILRRFEQESQALAKLQHAGIAQIYEVGSSPQPHLVMELIRGESLLRYADNQQLNTRQRLELMVKVCEAVHHAHQRGIIHRDLKPGNICVDECGQPKILDFGIARIVGGDPHATAQTDSGQIVGTMAYMSPEQVLGDPLDLDTRSDVYSLGVTLFQLLVGRLPYPVSRNLPEAIPAIRDTAATPLGSIDRSFRGDIETIVSKALEKDKARRYSSAAELAGDLGRHLRDEPIMARPSTLSYHLWKFASRHRPAVAAAAVVVMALFGAVIVSTREATLAVAEKARADAINEFLEHDLLAQASSAAQARPSIAPDPDLKVRTALDRAAARLAGKFDKQPLVEASIRRTIGKAYKDLGLYPDAHRQLERALELQRGNRESLQTTNDIADVFVDEGKYREAEPLFLRVLAVRRRALGDRDPATLATMNALAWAYANEGKYADAETLYREVLQVRRQLLGEKHPDTLLSMNNLARLEIDEGKYADAEPLCIRVLEGRRRVLGEAHPDTLISEDNLGRLYINEGRYGEAERLLSAVLNGRMRVLGEQHPDTFISANNLAVTYRKQGRSEEAVHLLRTTLERQRSWLGEENPDTLLMMNNLARAYMDQGKYSEAEPLLQKVVAVQRRVVGERHPDTLIMMRNLGRLYAAQSKRGEAETLLSKVVQIQTRVLGPEHPDTLISASDLAHVRRAGN